MIKGMRELAHEEIRFVCGAGDSDGGDAVDAARNVCTTNDLPDDTQVTITMQVGGSLGMGSTNTTTSTTVEIQTTCGELTADNGGG